MVYTYIMGKDSLSACAHVYKKMSKLSLSACAHVYKKMSKLSLSACTHVYKKMSKHSASACVCVLETTTNNCIMQFFVFLRLCYTCHKKSSQSID